MARYTGPRVKKLRQIGAVLPGLTTVSELTRNYPPGEHGAQRKGKPSEYKIRLVEKQKARLHFGILEAQFRRYVEKAARLKGAAGKNLVLLLESRLDNIVWRLGFSRTIPQARQLIVHGHVQVDGHRVDRPSFHVKAGSTITLRERERNKAFIQAMVAESAAHTRPSWLEIDPAKLSGKLLSAPERGDLPFELDENKIIEYYSQKL